MRVAAYSSDEGSCGHYRITYPGRACRALGVRVHLGTEIPVSVGKRKDGLLDVLDCKVPDGTDVVVMQRPLGAALVETIPILQARGIAVVVEIDDDFHSIHPDNMSRLSCDPAVSPDSNWDHLWRATQTADLVTVTTQALADRYGAHGRVAVLPNFVPGAMCEINAPRNGRTVGWQGTVGVHPGDLTATGGGVATAVRAEDAYFFVVGDGEYVQRDLGLDDPPEATGWVDHADVPSLFASVDVGIAPLLDTQFNRAKSRIKPLEFGALGIPSVVSPTPEYSLLAAQRIGAMASRASEWHSAVRALLRDEGYRYWCGEEARQAVREYHTIEANAWRWAEAWEQAIHNRRTGPPQRWA